MFKGLYIANMFQSIFILNLLMPNRQKKLINTKTSKENCIKQMQQSGTIEHAENILRNL